ALLFVVHILRRDVALAAPLLCQNVFTLCYGVAHAFDTRLADTLLQNGFEQRLFRHNGIALKAMRERVLDGILRIEGLRFVPFPCFGNGGKLTLVYSLPPGIAQFVNAHWGFGLCFPRPLPELGLGPRVSDAVLPGLLLNDFRAPREPVAQCGIDPCQLEAVAVALNAV